MRRLSIALFAAAALCLVPSAAHAATTYQVPASIDSTGTLDVTSQLNHFMAGVPDGSTIAFRANGRYRVEGTLTLVERNHLTILGNQAQTFTTARGGPQRANWEIDGGDGIVIQDLKAQGANPQPDWSKGYDRSVQWQAGFDLVGVHTSHSPT